MSEEGATPAGAAGDQIKVAPAAQTAGLGGAALIGPPAHQHSDGVLHAELPGDLTSSRQARQTIRQALAGWGMETLSDDAELLTSELVANAAEHTPGKAIGLRLRWHCGPAGSRDITCEVTDTSPDLPQPRAARPDDERGRGLAIVAALASSSGVRTSPVGKTSWFTLANSGRSPRFGMQPEPEAEPGA